MIEFAKPYMPLGNWVGDIEKAAAQKEFEAKNKKKTGDTAVIIKRVLKGKA